MGAPNAYEQDVSKPLLHGQESPSCSADEDCTAHQYDAEARQKAGASSLPDSLPPPIHTRSHKAESHEEEIPPATQQSQGEMRVMDGGAHARVIIVRQGELSPLVICPWCHRQGPTIQYKQNGFCTWFAAFLTCATGCWPLCPFTFCIDAFKDTVHHCSHCRHYLGRTLA